LGDGEPQIKAMKGGVTTIPPFFIAAGGNPEIGDLEGKKDMEAPVSLMRMEGITKVFPGVIANDDVSFDLLPGEIHALVGENGAGKTTLMKILYGLYKPDSGSIFIKEKPITIRNPRDAIRQGIGMVHQHFMLVPPFTVIENIILGEETHTAGYLQLDEPAKKVQQLMEENGLVVDLQSKVEDIPVGLQQRVEILKILYRGAEILIFDEPTAVLTPQEVEDLFNTFREMKEQGRSIVFISHKLDEVLEIADRITVIRRGRIVETLDRQNATKPMIAELMVGKPVLLKVDNPKSEPGETVLEVKELSLTDEFGTKRLDRVSFSISKGEIYGIAGVEGNGQTELVQVLSERVHIDEGGLFLNGERFNDWDVRKRREAGIGHIPEDRHRFGLLLPFPLSSNLILGRHHRPPFVGRLQTIKTQTIRDFARKVIQQYDIRTPSETVPASTLSGGNQQKVIVAREMSADPRLLLASQPTRGVDIGATEFIYKELVEAKTNNKAVLLVSADLDEILSLADRIGVIYKGRIIREFERSKTTKEEVGFFMMGEKHEAETAEGR
jgi:ABC-type uncharacterized transport system ATPase subunit